MTDTSTRPAPATASRWEWHSSAQTFAELLLGLSFIAAVSFGGYSAATGQLTVVSQVAGVVFLVTLVCVLVSWFRAVEQESDHAARPARTARTASPTTPQRPVSTDAIATIDAEYRR